jgi:hypothetical protein
MMVESVLNGAVISIAVNLALGSSLVDLPWRPIPGAEIYLFKDLKFMNRQQISKGLCPLLINIKA